MRAPHEHELEPSEGEDPGGGRPAPKPDRIREWGGEWLGSASGERAHAARGSPPRVERAEDVAEQHAQHREAHPEEDEHGSRSEVRRRDLSAGHPADHDQEEQRDADCPARRRQPSRERQEPHTVWMLEPGSRPQGRQREERHEQHGAGRPREQPCRNREIRATEQAVGRGRGRPCDRGREQRGGRQQRGGGERGASHAEWRVSRSGTMTRGHRP